MRKAHACRDQHRGMRRVVVVGAGLCGLAAALEVAAAGYAVVVLEARDRVGGRATTTAGTYVDVGFGPHVLLRGGSTHRLASRVARVKLVTTPLQPHRIHVVGHGPMRSLKGIRSTALTRRTLRRGDVGGPSAAAARLLAGWGLSSTSNEIASRAQAMLMGHGLLLREGWAGLVGRLVATLDEVGVPIETGARVVEASGRGVVLQDGRTLEADAVLVANGPGGRPSTLENEQGHRVSTVDALVQAVPMRERHGLVDVVEGCAVLRMPHNDSNMTMLSAIALPRPDEADAERLARLEAWLDQHLSGWSTHLAEDRRQGGITVALSNGEAVVDVDGVLYARPVNGLSDAAIDAGRAAGKRLVARGER